MIITIPLTKDLKRFLSWWTVHPMVTSGRPFQESHPMATVMTDVSLSGWGRLGRSIWAQVCGKQRKEIANQRSRNNRSSTSGKTERTGIFPVQPSQGLVPTALGRSLFPSIFERPYIELLVTADNARLRRKKMPQVPSALGASGRMAVSVPRIGSPVHSEVGTALVPRQGDLHLSTWIMSGATPKQGESHHRLQSW